MQIWDIDFGQLPKGMATLGTDWYISKKNAGIVQTYNIPNFLALVIFKLTCFFYNINTGKTFPRTCRLFCKIT